MVCEVCMVCVRAWCMGCEGRVCMVCVCIYEHVYVCVLLKNKTTSPNRRHSH